MGGAVSFSPLLPGSVCVMVPTQHFYLFSQESHRWILVIAHKCHPHSPSFPSSDTPRGLHLRTPALAVSSTGQETRMASFFFLEIGVQILPVQSEDFPDNPKYNHPKSDQYILLFSRCDT